MTEHPEDKRLLLVTAKELQAILEMTNTSTRQDIHDHVRGVVAAAVEFPMFIEPGKNREFMQAMARALDVSLNGGGASKIGFSLFVFAMGGEPGLMNYVSSANREDIVESMKAWITRQANPVHPGSESVQ